MSVWSPPRAIEIDKKLRDDARRLLREYGITTQETDPILAVLFRSLAVRVEEVYEQAAESIPLAVLDELMAGLGMPERRAQPAQTVIHFTLYQGRHGFAAGTECIGEARSKERLTFALDTPIEVSPAAISLVAIYQNGSLRLHSGTELPKAFEDARPSFEAVPADLGPHPAIYMAIDVPDEGHLSQHGLYVELTPEARELLTALQRETWCLFDNQGELRAPGMLRARVGNAGVQRLTWLVAEAASTATTEAGVLPEGFYGGRVFLFPEIPPERRFLTPMPRNMAEPLRRIFHTAGAALFDRPRAWLCIMLPQQGSPVNDQLIRVVLHCTTASNIEILNETIALDPPGTAIPVSNGSGQPRHLVKLMAILGEHGSEYLDAADPNASAYTGRYRMRQGCLEIEPARPPQGLPDRYANVRLLLANGALDNEERVDSGAITTFLKKAVIPTLEIRNLTMAAGGTNGESFRDAQRRFAELLLARERAVTHADLKATLKAFEPKVRTVHCQPGLERIRGGLRRVHRVTVGLDRGAFVAPDEEANRLQHELEAHLQAHTLLGLEMRVDIAWL